MQGTAILDSAKVLLEEFSRGNRRVKKCTLTKGKVTGPSHQASPDAIRCKSGDYNITVTTGRVLVGVRHKGMAFSCYLDTPDPNRVKQELKESLRLYA